MASDNLFKCTQTKIFALYPSRVTAGSFAAGGNGGSARLRTHDERLIGSSAGIYV
jgi:hypothetical protein